MKKTGASFLGTGWGFPPRFRRGENSVAMVADEQDIRQSLHILLTTALGERLMRPDFGCDLKQYLFEPLTASLQSTLKDLIETAILYHEPRVTPEDIQLSAFPEQGRLDIELRYRVRATNTRDNFVFPFYQDEGSGITP